MYKEIDMQGRERTGENETKKECLKPNDSSLGSHKLWGGGGGGNFLTYFIHFDSVCTKQHNFNSEFQYPVSFICTLI